VKGVFGEDAKKRKRRSIENGKLCRMKAKRIGLGLK
jgi:hypothetical protein